MSSLTIGRLSEERKSWRKYHPTGFSAKPRQNSDGTLNLREWDCVVPGKKKSLWEGGQFKVVMSFPFDYPLNPPKVRFTPKIFHPNVYPAGVVCLSLLDKEKDWRAAIMIPQILIGIQELLDHPNLESPANKTASELYQNDREAYNDMVRQQTRTMSF